MIDDKRKYLPWVAGFVVWTALPLLQAAQTAMWLTSRNQPVEWGELITFRLVDWYACGIFIPLLLWATHRWPLDRRHLVRRILPHVALLVLVSAAKIVVFHNVRGSFGMPTTNSLAQAFAGGLIGEVIAFAATAAAIHAIVFYLRDRDREALTLQLQARLNDAQLHALRAQLNPHFLFNALNAVTTLLHRDPHRADAMLTRLGELLRITLRADPDHEIPLRDELALLDRYLDIMRMRFSDRVTVSRDVDSAAVDALVPSFLLQPIVENAFEHGVARLQAPGRVEVGASLAAGGTQVVLRVRDNGPGPSADGASDGIGITNTRRRLQAMYAGAGQLDLSAAPGGGMLVEMRFPYRSALGRA